MPGLAHEQETVPIIRLAPRSFVPNPIAMRRTAALAFIAITLAPFTAHAQRASEQEPSPRIEVTGVAEMQIVPDEIHIAIELRERGSGNNKVSVEQQELQLRDAIKALGIDVERLTLSDAVADYVPKKFRKDDVIARKGYMLKLADAEQVRKVFLELDRLEIDEARIHHVSHSKEQEYRRQMRVQAITAAKEKADYLLAAIGENTGPALKVEEVQPEHRDPRIYGNVNRLMAVEAYGYSGGTSSYESLGVNFSRIVIRSEVACVFAIAAR